MLQFLLLIRFQMDQTSKIKQRGLTLDTVTLEITRYLYGVYTWEAKVHELQTGTIILS